MCDSIAHASFSYAPHTHLRTQQEDDTDCGTGWLLTSVDFTPKAPVMSAAVYLLQSTQFGRVYTVFDKISLQEL